MTTQRPPNATYAYAGAFVDELARSGVRHVCVCPGSRSTPLAICFARERRIRVWMHLDERSAAFFALGLARATREPVAIVCTSGTAAANFMPAVVEARQAQVPLLVLTADRPPELRDCGAPQTIDQIRFYGTQVKWAVEMATPGAGDELLRYARTTACRAMATALANPSGPVHLNFPFREPLTPVEAPEEIPTSATDLALYGRPDGQPFATSHMPTLAQDGATIESLAADLVSLPHGLIVCGPMDEPALAEPLTALARQLGYPILADPLSGLRAGPRDRELIVDSYDAFLRDERFARQMVPQVVLRFGAMPTAKPLLHYLQRHPQARQIVVSRGDWPDPSLLAAYVITADPARFCAALAEAIEPAPEVGGQTRRPKPDRVPPSDPKGSGTAEALNRAASEPTAAGRVPTRGWLPSDLRRKLACWPHTWLEAARYARQALAATLEAMDEPFEGRVFAELAGLLPEDATLYVGNSMPVRDLDTFLPARALPLHILGNRGANGIDGLVSSALGAAAAGGGPTVLVLGDISFYHDMNGLLAARRHGLNLVVVVINNDGGGIFSFLPQAAYRDTPGDPGWSFEELFGTPHGLDFARAAALYGATYTRIAGWDDFRHAVTEGMEAGGVHIVELPTDRARNVTLHRRCWPAVAEAIAGTLDAALSGEC